MNDWEIVQGDALERLREMPDESVQCVVTSPPYWGLRDYGVAGQLGLEVSPWEYVENMRSVFSEVRRVLRTDGTLWLNMGDCYATGAGKVGECPGGGERGEKWVGDRGGHEGKHGYRTPYESDRSGGRPQWAGRGGRPRGTRPTGQGGLMDDGRAKRPPIGLMTQANRMPIEGLKPKDLVGMPWRLAFALQADGWWLRRDIIWSKPNPMPESITDRPTTAHEYVFLFTRAERYYYDADAIREPLRLEASALLGRNRRSVWEIATTPFHGAHFATFPEKLVLPCVLAGSRSGDLILDPFAGAATVGVVALKNGRRFVGIELNPEYCEMGRRRIASEVGGLQTVLA